MDEIIAISPDTVFISGKALTESDALGAVESVLEVVKWQCTKCLEWKEAKDFYKHKLRSKNGLTSHCKTCINQYVKDSKERITKWRRDTIEDRRSYQRGRNARNRNTFLDMYGGKCACCGETEKEFLAIDHIKGKNRRHKSNNPYECYIDAIKNYDPIEYRILCHNCNQATKEGRICPHQLKKELSNV